MNLKITYRHLEATDAIDAKIRDKAEHLKKYFRGKLDVHWVCDIKGKEHCVEINVHAGHDYFHAHGADKCLYNTLDIALKKMETQLRKRDDRIKDKIHRHHKKTDDINPPL